MTATGSSLPTAWLAPPPGLLSSNQAVEITHIPIAISATIALLAGALTIVLFSRKNKEVFLEDKIIQVPENQEPLGADTSIRSPINISSPIPVRLPEAVLRALSATASPQTPQPYTAQTNPPNFSRPQRSQQQAADWQPSGQKLDDVLGFDRDWEARRNPTPHRSPPHYDSYIAAGAPGKSYDMEEETFHDEDDEKSSVTVPFSVNKVEYNEFGIRKDGLGGLDSSHISETSSTASERAIRRIQRAVARTHVADDSF